MGRINTRDGYAIAYAAEKWEPNFVKLQPRKDAESPVDGAAWAEAEFWDCVRLERLANQDEVNRTGIIAFSELEAIPSDQDLEVWAELDALGISLRNLLKTLSEREAKILTLRFGLDGGGIRDLRHLAGRYDVSRERIRQIEAKALRRLRHPTRSRQLYSYTHRGPVKPEPEPEPEFMPYPEERRLRDRAAALYWSTVLT